jgi:hypothetical protein
MFYWFQRNSNVPAMRFFYNKVTARVEEKTMEITLARVAGRLSGRSPAIWDTIRHGRRQMTAKCQ